MATFIHATAAAMNLVSEYSGKYSIRAASINYYSMDNTVQKNKPTYFYQLQHI